MTSGLKRANPSSVGLTMLVLLLSASDLSAQGQPTTPAAEDQRKGLAGGLSTGWGAVTVSPTVPEEFQPRHSNGLALGLWAGWSLTDRFAAVVDMDFVGVRKEGFSPLVLVAAAQYWPTARVWLKGGVGSGRVSAVASQGISLATERGRAFSAAAGFELVRAREYGVDLQLRVTQTNLYRVRARSISAHFGLAKYSVWGNF